MAGIVEPRGMVDLQADQTNPLLRTREYISKITLLSGKERVRVFSMGRVQSFSPCTSNRACWRARDTLPAAWAYIHCVVCVDYQRRRKIARKRFTNILSRSPFGAIELFPAPVGAVAGRASITPIPNIVHFGGFNVDQTQTFKLVSSNRFTTFLLPSCSSSPPRFPFPFAFVCTAIVCLSASS